MYLEYYTQLTAHWYYWSRTATLAINLDFIYLVRSSMKMNMVVIKYKGHAEVVLFDIQTSLCDVL